MTRELRSEQISARLLFLMAVVILSVLLIAVPQIVNSYRDYLQSKQALIDIHNLRIFAETSNKISRERAPSNKAMSAETAEDSVIKFKELQKYRQGVNQQIDLTVKTLNQAGYYDLAKQVDVQLRADLLIARKQIDDYIFLAKEARTSGQMDDAILGMFAAWDSCRVIFRQLVIESKHKNSEVTNYATMVLLLADLRDQAGRIGSNIMAPLSFSEKISEYNAARSLQAQEQAKYLWRLTDSIQPEELKTDEYTNLHQAVKYQFIDQAIPMVKRLLNESRTDQPYFMKANQLTEALVDKFTTVINLQTYLLDTHAQVALKEMRIAQRQFVLTLLISLISLAVIFFTMLYIRKKLLEPLIEARNTIVDLSHVHDETASIQSNDTYTLYDAIHKLKEMLKQRDAFEFQLKGMANTDSLTGVSNRLALDAYLKDIDTKKSDFRQFSLIVLDIDNFKVVNDQFGHTLGDMVIMEIAECLKTNISHLDLIVRFGGDEFLILLAKSQLDWTMQIAESILADVSRLRIDLPASSEKLRVSVSIGVATGADNWKELFNKADESLFRAKAQGRNKAVG